MANKGTYKQGGSGKGDLPIKGFDKKAFDEGFDRTKGTRKVKCLDCKQFKGINIIDIVNCPENNHKGLKICSNFEDK